MYSKIKYVFVLEYNYRILSVKLVLIKLIILVIYFWIIIFLAVK